MNADWQTDEQVQLRQMLRLALSGGITVRELADLGIYGATLADDVGGSSAGTGTALVVAEEIGRARSTIPFAENVILAGTLIDRLGSAEQRHRLLPRITDGSLQVSTALVDLGGTDPFETAALAVRDGSSFLLSGIKAPVSRAAEAELIVVPVLFDGGLSLHLIEPSLLRLSATYETIDGVAASTVDLGGVRADESTLLGQAGVARGVFEEALDLALAVQAAEAVGIIAYLVEATRAHLLERVQFGKSLASFQVLRHRMVEMILRHQQAESLVTKMRVETDVSGAHLRHRSAIAAAVVAAKAARFVGQEAVQLHGGMGMTEELGVGPALKRLYVLETRFGSIEKHAARYGSEVYA